MRTTAALSLVDSDTNMPDMNLAYRFSPEQVLCFSGVAALVSLAFACGSWLARRSMRSRALHVLGFVKPTGSAVGPGVRYAGVIAVAIVTIFVLTPTSPGAGDADPAAEATPPAATVPPAEVVIVEVRAEGATIVVQGNTVEIRLVSVAPTSAVDAISIHPSGDIAAPKPTATPPASALPEGME